MPETTDQGSKPETTQGEEMQKLYYDQKCANLAIARAKAKANRATREKEEITRVIFQLTAAELEIVTASMRRRRMKNIRGYAKAALLQRAAADAV